MSGEDLKKLAAMIAEILNVKQDGPRPRKTPPRKPGTI